MYIHTKIWLNILNNAKWKYHLAFSVAISLRFLIFDIFYRQLSTIFQKLFIIRNIFFAYIYNEEK